jgi:hypothetical protein
VENEFDWFDGVGWPLTGVVMDDQMPEIKERGI